MRGGHETSVYDRPLTSGEYEARRALEEKGNRATSGAQVSLRTAPLPRRRGNASRVNR